MNPTKKIVNIVILSILFLNILSLSAQTNTDSLKKRLIDTPKDTLYIKTLINIGDIYKNNSPDSSLYYYNEALNISKEIKDIDFQIEAYSVLASLKISMEEYQKALIYYALEKDLCVKTNNKEKLKYIIGNSGVIYFYLSNYPKALSNFYDLEKVAIELNDSFAIAAAYTNIGIIYKKLNENEKALEYFNKNLKIAEKINSKLAISDSYNNIGLIFQDRNNDSIAINYFEKSIEVSKEVDDFEGIAVANLNIGISKDAMHKCEDALLNFETAYEIAKKNKSKRITAEAEYEIANIYLRFSNSDKYNFSKKKQFLNEAIIFANDSYKISKSYDYLNTVKKVTKLLVEIYQKKGNTNKALNFALEHITVKDSIFKNENLEAIQKMNAKYEIYKSKLEIAKKEEEIKINEKQIELQNTIINVGIIAGIIFLLFLSLIIFLFFRIKKQKNNLVSLKNLQRRLIDNLPIHIYLKNKELKYQLINESYAKLLKSPMDKIIGKSDLELNESWKKFEDIDMQIMAINEPIFEFKEEFIDDDGNRIWFSVTKVPYHDEKGSVIGIIGIVSDISLDIRLNFRLQRLLDESRKQRKIITQVNKNITDSITYAKTIQDGVLPSKRFLEEVFNEYFILYKPYGIVSGDFYYANKNKDTLIFSVADCTGHGVPGAFLTMLAISFLNQIIFDAGNTVPSTILDILNNKIRRTFENSKKQNISGLDIGVCSVDMKTNTLQFAGAFISLYILRNEELVEYKASRIPLGTNYFKKSFVNYKVELHNDDVIYLFSDGYGDQLGGKEMKKFSKRKFIELIMNNKNKTLEEQKQILKTNLREWQGGNKQFDDITVMAIKWKI